MVKAVISALAMAVVAAYDDDEVASLLQQQTRLSQESTTATTPTGGLSDQQECIKARGDGDKFDEECRLTSYQEECIKWDIGTRWWTFPEQVWKQYLGSESLNACMAGPMKMGFGEGSCGQFVMIRTEEACKAAAESLNLEYKGLANKDDNERWWLVPEDVLNERPGGCYSVPKDVPVPKDVRFGKGGGNKGGGKGGRSGNKQDVPGFSAVSARTLLSGTRQCKIRSHFGNYLQAAGGPPVADVPMMDENKAANFVIIGKNSYVCIRTSAGKYLTALPNGQLKSAAALCLSSQRFQVRETRASRWDPSRVGIRSVFGKYISVQPSNNVLADRSGFRSWEQMIVSCRGGPSDPLPFDSADPLIGLGSEAVYFNFMVDLEAGSGSGTGVCHTGQLGERG